MTSKYISQQTDKYAAQLRMALAAQDLYDALENALAYVEDCVDSAEFDKGVVRKHVAQCYEAMARAVDDRSLDRAAEAAADAADRARDVKEDR